MPNFIQKLLIWPGYQTSLKIRDRKDIKKSMTDFFLRVEPKPQNSGNHTSYFKISASLQEKLHLQASKSNKWNRKDRK